MVCEKEKYPKNTIYLCYFSFEFHIRDLAQRKGKRTKKLMQDNPSRDSNKMVFGRGRRFNIVTIEGKVGRTYTAGGTNAGR